MKNKSRSLLELKQNEVLKYSKYKQKWQRLAQARSLRSASFMGSRMCCCPCQNANHKSLTSDGKVRVYWRDNWLQYRYHEKIKHMGSTLSYDATWIK